MWILVMSLALWFHRAIGIPGTETGDLKVDSTVAKTRQVCTKCNLSQVRWTKARQCWCLSVSRWKTMASYRGPGSCVVHLPIWNALLNLADRINSSSDKAWCLDVVNVHGLDISNVSVPSKAHQNMFRKTQPPSVLMRQWRKETRKTGSGDTWHNDNYHRPYTVYFSHANHPPLEVGCQFIWFLVGPDARWDQRDPSRPAVNL